MKDVVDLSDRISKHGMELQHKYRRRTGRQWGSLLEVYAQSLEARRVFLCSKVLRATRALQRVTSDKCQT